MKRRLRSHLTYANVMASIAIFLALGGSAFAAVVVTGANVKNNSLTGIDVKNGSLVSADLSAAARRAFKGAKGATGATGLTGPRGLTGETGPKGDTGAPGAPAEVVTSFASRDTGFVVRNTFSTPNPSGTAWWNYNCGGINSDVAGCGGAKNGNQSNNGVGVIQLIPAGVEVLALQGMTKDPMETSHTITTNNNLVVPWSNNLTGMASVSLMHTGTIHERMSCTIQYANAASSGTFTSLGESQMISSFEDKEIVSLTIVASRNVPAGTYNLRVMCFDMDSNATGTPSWRFIRGNLTAMAARNG